MTAPHRHRIRTAITAAGFTARCAGCGWASTRRTRELRDQDVNTHETTAAADALNNRPEET